MTGPSRHHHQLRVRYRAIAGYTGLICVVIGLFLLTPLLLLLSFPQEQQLVPAFLIPGLGLSLAGGLLWWRLAPKTSFSLSYQEGAVIVALVWTIAILTGALPFGIGLGMTVTQAIFESTSGWTTTGLSVVDVTTAPHLILFYRSLTQLAGGAGFVIIALSALTGPGGVGISAAEGRAEQLVPHVRRSAKLVITLYLSYCVVGTLALYVAGMGWFDAVNHAFGALSTGGFSTRVDSIGYWDSPVVEAVVVILMLLGTLNFLTAYTLLQRNFRAVLRNGELRLEAALLIIAALVLFGGVLSVPDLYPVLTKQLRVAIFETVTALSTTGFSTVGYTQWNSLGWITLVILMLVGGGTGSTAGAIKQYRIVVLLRAVGWELRRLLLPRSAVTEPDIWQGGERTFLHDGQIRQVAVFVTLYLVTFLVGSMIVAAHGYSVQESLFEFASTLGTVGLSIGVTAADAPVTMLWTQIVGMVLGRLEFFPILVGVVKIAGDLRVLVRR